MTVPTLLVCEPGSEAQPHIEELIASHSNLQYLGAVSRQAASKQIQQSGTRLIWIDLEPEPMKGLTLLGDLIELYPRHHFLVSHDTLQADLVKTAMQLGAVDFLDSKTWDQQLPDVINRVEAKEAAQQERVSQQSISLAHITEVPMGGDAPKNVSKMRAHAVEMESALPVWLIPSIIVILLVVLGASYFIKH